MADQLTVALVSELGFASEIQARWDRREIYYISGDRHLQVVDRWLA